MDLKRWELEYSSGNQIYFLELGCFVSGRFYLAGNGLCITGIGFIFLEGNARSDVMGFFLSETDVLRRDWSAYSKPNMSGAF
ncbi:MAG TPA: hypothetical protein VKX33_10395 [Cyclobacteriaceae bacterium]|nr:hypothetical protein [Cyclobacteriaceae bacterium]